MNIQTQLSNTDENERAEARELCKKSEQIAAIAFKNVTPALENCKIEEEKYAQISRTLKKADESEWTAIESLLEKADENISLAEAEYERINEIYKSSVRVLVFHEEERAKIWKKTATVDELEEDRILDEDIRRSEYQDLNELSDEDFIYEEKRKEDFFNGRMPEWELG